MTKQDEGRQRYEDRCGVSVSRSWLVLRKHSKYYLVDQGLRRPCYVIVIIVCLCKLVCGYML